MEIKYFNQEVPINMESDSKNIEKMSIEEAVNIIKPHADVVVSSTFNLVINKTLNIDTRLIRTLKIKETEGSKKKFIDIDFVIPGIFVFFYLDNNSVHVF